MATIPASWAEMERLELADIGDFRIAHGDIQGTLAKIEEQAAPFRHLVALGGDHTITLALLRALARRKGPLGLVHFDGHVDTWPESFGLVFGHGSPFYHAIEEGLIDPRRTIQIGIRSPLHRDIFDWTVGKGVTIVSAEDVHETGPQTVAERIRAVVGDEPAYLSFDVDALDPAFAPGNRHARSRRAGDLAGAGDPAPARRPRVSPGWMWSRCLRPTMSPRSPRSPRRRWPGTTSPCSRPALKPDYRRPNRRKTLNRQAFFLFYGSDAIARA